MIIERKHAVKNRGLQFERGEGKGKNQKKGSTAKGRERDLIAEGVCMSGKMMTRTFKFLEIHRI